MAKKAVSVEVLRKYLHYFPSVALELKKLGMEITKSLSDIGSIYGNLDEEHFDKVESWKETLGVFVEDPDEKKEPIV